MIAPCQRFEPIVGPYLGALSMRRDAVPVFLAMSVCLIISRAECSGADAYSLTRLGGRMSVDEKVALEEQVTKRPNDVEARTKLLGYYFIKGRQDADAKSAKQRHVVWLIENAPESEVLGLPYSQLNKILEPEGYQSGKQAWLRTLEQSPENLLIL